ncbi:MAG: hypothetical protein V4469_00475 [Patescibacteria group bacterium]
MTTTTTPAIHIIMYRSASHRLEASSEQKELRTLIEEALELSKTRAVDLTSMAREQCIARFNVTFPITCIRHPATQVFESGDQVIAFSDEPHCFTVV